ncbi:TauD/TfdA family dioxygenase [Amycolatopsis sp. GM8]|uniref:TauD/TfdA dioxygenase family protein n=1 Tax=Amycolatopsis sp. GM8 TaxID=2896530 RepID=UPI001F3F7EC9|nr:TauD/TfdA family dioxygenase [Amycolatopsis sp. GM8]
MRTVPIGKSLAAEVLDVDLTMPPSEARHSAIVEAADRYAVLVFRNQAISAEQQAAWLRTFGPLDTEVQRYFNRIDANRLGSDVVTDISNVDARGDVAARLDRQTVMNIGNAFWHSDGSHYHRPFRYSMLAAVAVPAWGGETEFADLRAAHDRLDPRTRDFLSARTGAFWSAYNRIRLGIFDPPETHGIYPPVEWPLIRTHPGSGRKVLWVGQPLCQISGLSVPEGRALASDLLEQATQPDNVYVHLWSPSDVVLWDNRSVLHRGRRFDFAERRELRRVGTKDDLHSLGALTMPSRTDLNDGFPLQLKGVPEALIS